MIELEVTGIEDTKTYLRTVRGRFSLMLQAMIDVAEVIHAETLPKTPFETGRLGESFEWKVIEYNRNLIEVEVEMDAIDPNSGFHYAEYQHNRDLRHPEPRAGQRFYLREGIFASEDIAYEIIEQDYLSLFRGVSIE